MAFLAKLFGKKKENDPAEEALKQEEGLTPEEEAAAEAAEAALAQEDEVSADESLTEELPIDEVIAEESMDDETALDPVQEPVVVETPVAEEPEEEAVATEEPEEIEETATKKSFWGRLKSGLTRGQPPEGFHQGRRGSAGRAGRDSDFRRRGLYRHRGDYGRAP